MTAVFNQMKNTVLKCIGEIFTHSRCDLRIITSVPETDFYRNVLNPKSPVMHIELPFMCVTINALAMGFAGISREDVNSHRNTLKESNIRLG